MSKNNPETSDSVRGNSLPIDRRGLLLGAALGAIGLSGSVAANEDEDSEDDDSEDGPPFADADHTHDGDVLGVDQPVSSINVEALLVEAYEQLRVGGAQVGSVQYYLKDDFGDDALSDRDGRVVGSFLESTENHETPPIGEYRPEWSIEDRPGDVFAEGGAMVTEGDSHVSTPSQFEAGEWSFDFRAEGNASFYIALMADAEFMFDNSWEVRFSGSSLRLERRENYQESGGRDSVTGVISTTWDADDDEHTIRVTREIVDAAEGLAEFELFYDGESRGTATEEFIPDTSHFRVRNIGTPRLEISNVGLGGQLRVDAGVDPENVVADEVTAEERLTIPVRDEDPENPEPGDIWLVEDL